MFFENFFSFLAAVISRLRIVLQFEFHRCEPCRHFSMHGNRHVRS